MEANVPLVKMKNVSLRFEDKIVLESLSISVQRRDRYVVVGRSGCGKSTLLRLIVGTLKPQSGSVEFDGKEVPNLRRSSLNKMRTRIGMVFQGSALLSSLTVGDNLALPLRELTKKNKSEIDRIVDEKLGLVEMSDAKNLMPVELSGGMKKRVGLARALVMDPDLILFDEPSAGLDPVTSAMIDELMIGLTEKQNVTSIVVTHEMESAFRVATKMAMLHEGNIIEENSPEQIKNSTNPIVHQFLTGDSVGPLTEGK